MVGNLTNIDGAILILFPVDKIINSHPFGNLYLNETLCGSLILLSSVYYFLSHQHRNITNM